MGDWTSIKVGASNVMHFYNRIPLFAVLIFDESDYIFDIERHPLYDDEGDNIIAHEEERLYKFSSTVKKIKELLSNRGIDEDFCERTFNELRADKVWAYSKIDDDYVYLPNIIDYEIYKQLLKQRVFTTDTHDNDEPDELALYRDIEKALFESEFPSLFWGEKGHAFDDTLAVIYLRTVLDIAPENAPVTLELHWLKNYEGMFETLYQDFVKMMLKKIELDYKIYGFVIRNDPNVDIRLKRKIEKINEDSFITKILIPLMKAMGFADVRPVTTHGQGEFGKDILPFKRVTEFDTLRYLALQAKAVTIHGSAGKGGNAGELLSQAINAFKIAFIDSADNERKRIDEFVIATNRDITAEAKRTIEEGIEGDRKITFLDVHQVVTLIKKYNLVEYVLFAITE